MFSLLKVYLTILNIHEKDFTFSVFLILIASALAKDILPTLITAFVRFDHTVL